MVIRAPFPILLRRPLMPLLVLLQVAVACAIMSNVLFLSWQQLQPMLAPTGIDNANLIVVSGLSKAHGSWTKAEVEASADALREVPGVRAVTAAPVDLPMAGGGVIMGALKGPSGREVGVNFYAGEGLVHTLGAHLIRGRTFLPDEYRTMHALQAASTVEPVIITESLARQLFGSAPAIGGRLSDPFRASGGYEVVGIVRHLLRSQVGLATDGRADNTAILPVVASGIPQLFYAVRVEPRMHAQALHGVWRILRRQFGTLVTVGSHPRAAFYDTLRGEVFQARSAALWLLVGVAVAVLIVTLAGIAGLTGFWIQRRTREIGIRRALGAKRRDILMYFQGENAFIVLAGVALGVVLAYAVNLMLVKYYGLPRLPLWYLPVGAAVMLLLGQLAVLAPALRAARVPPVVATRSV